MPHISLLTGKAMLAITTFVIGLAFQHPLVMQILATQPKLFPFTAVHSTPYRPVRPNYNLPPYTTPPTATSSISVASSSPTDTLQTIPDITSSSTLITPKTLLSGSSVSIGANALNGLVFTVLPVYELKSATWSGFDGYEFNVLRNSVAIYKGGVKIAEPSSYSWTQFDGAIGNVSAFTYGGRDFFVLWGTNCGNGGCGDENVLFSGTSGTSTPPVSIWQHGWTWGHGGEPVTGFQGDEKLDMVILYHEKLFLFPTSNAPIIELDGNGNILQKISDRTLPLNQILNSYYD